MEKMLRPPRPWPYTGRLYPEGAQLRMAHVHEKWADLVWFDSARKVEVYLSTRRWSHFKPKPYQRCPDRPSRSSKPKPL